MHLAKATTSTDNYEKGLRHCTSRVRPKINGQGTKRHV